MNNWIIGQKHKVFGKVIAMGIREGEPYRFFINKNRVISLIPLSCLQSIQKDSQQRTKNHCKKKEATQNDE